MDSTILPQASTSPSTPPGFAPTPQAQVIPPVMPPIQNQIPPKKRHSMIFVVLILLFAVIAGVLIYMNFMKSKPQIEEVVNTKKEKVVPTSTTSQTVVEKTAKTVEFAGNFKKNHGATSVRKEATLLRIVGQVKKAEVVDGSQVLVVSFPNNTSEVFSYSIKNNIEIQRIDDAGDASNVTTEDLVENAWVDLFVTYGPASEKYIIGKIVILPSPDAYRDNYNIKK